MPSAEILTLRAIDILSKLVGFDTTSRLSNLALIEWVEAYLDGHGVVHRRVPNPDGTKSNLLASVVWVSRQDVISCLAGGGTSAKEPIRSMILSFPWKGWG